MTHETKQKIIQKSRYIIILYFVVENGQKFITFKQGSEFKEDTKKKVHIATAYTYKLLLVNPQFRISVQFLDNPAVIFLFFFNRY